MKLIVADDDPFIVTSLTTILQAQPDIEVAATAHDGAAAFTAWREHRPDIALLDIQMPGASGLDAGRAILAEDPAAKVVFLTTFADDEYIVAALRMGAAGYLIKQAVATIAPALRSVMAGQSVLGSEVVGRVPELLGATPSAKPQAAPPGWDGLTEREREIVALVAEGLDNKEIAGRVYISEGTVRNHISAILAKLNLKNRTQLAILYYRA